MKRWVALLLVLPWDAVAAGELEQRPRSRPSRSGHCWSWADAATITRHQKDVLTRGISQRAHVEWTVAYDPDTSNGHKNPVYDNPDWAKGFDVIVHDECSSHVNDMASIETILKPHKEGLPAVVLHCGMHCYRTEGWNRK